MFGWKAKIGLITPTHRGQVFAFWYEHVPKGVEIVPTFIGFKSSDRQTFESAFARVEELASELQDVGCNIVVVLGTPPMLLKGPDFEREWGDRTAQKLGIPVVTPMYPHVLAMQAMGLRRIGIATYYGDELNEAIVRYLQHFGIEGVVFGGFELPGRGQALYRTSMIALEDVGAEQVYRYCRGHFEKLGGSIDGIYINGGGWDAVPAINELEADLHTKVILGFTAVLWLTFRTLSIAVSIEDCGDLLRANFALPPSAR